MSDSSPLLRKVPAQPPPKDTVPPSAGGSASDSSPLIQRKIRLTTSQDPPSKKSVPPSPGGKVTIRRKPPVIKTSQDSPEKILSKDTVPPSAGGSALGAPAIPSHDVPSTKVTTPKPKRALKRPGRSKKQVSRRQQMLENPLLDLLAKECDSDGASVEGSQHSEDDKCVLPPCSSFITQLTLIALQDILQICRMLLTVLILMGTTHYTLQA